LLIVSKDKLIAELFDWWMAEFGIWLLIYLTPAICQNQDLQDFWICRIRPPSVCKTYERLGYEAAAM